MRLTISRRHRLFAALAFLVLAFIVLILLNSRWLGSARVDLTADHLYTLTPGTEQIVDHLQRPLRLTLYFSGHATRDLPQLRSYEQRVYEMLQEIVARSHGRIGLQVADPIPYSDDEASAEGNGLTPLNIGSNGERVFFGLVASAVRSDSELATDGDDHPPGRTLVIPLFDPQRESFLEYDIVKLLYELGQPNKPKVGLISSLPLNGDPPGSDNTWAVMRQLEQLFDMQIIDPAKLTRIPDDVHVLLVVHPKQLSDDAQYAIDQFVLGGGRLAVFVDPDAEMDTAPYVDSNSGVIDDHHSDLPRLFKAWGVLYDPGKVVLDRSRGLQIELVGGNSLVHAAMLGLGGQELNRSDAITASLQRINVASAGYFDLAATTDARLEPLLQSSADAEVVPTQRVVEASSDPSSLLQNYVAGNQHYVIAALLRGAFASAFPERANQRGHLTQAPAGSEVMLVADTDLLSDRLWLDTQNFLGQPVLSPFANNGEFVSNLIGNLSGPSALLSIPGRSNSQRPFTRVLALQSAADQKFKAKEQELEQELDDARRRLDELQPAKGVRTGTINVEQKREIEQFLQRKLAISKELRDVQHQLNAEIDALGLRLKVLNIVLMPALVALAGLLYGWRRVRRRQRHE